MGGKNDFLNNFPFNEIRERQRRVLEWLQENWDKYRFFVMELPTGFGKSAVSNAVGVSLKGGTFLLTVTKQLQDQYVRDFKEPAVVALKGKANYRCNVNPTLNVECGPCIVNKDLLRNCKGNNVCAYYNQRNKALNARIAVLTVPFFLFATTCGRYWSPREAIIIDECHLLEQQLVQWATIEVSPSQIEKEYELTIPRYTINKSGFKENRFWLQTVWNQIVKRRSEFLNEIKDLLNGRDPDDLSEDELEEIVSQHGMYYKIDKLYKKMEVFFRSPVKENWLIEPKGDGLILTPVEVHDLFKRYVNSMAKSKIIFMSATILDLNGFCKTFGLDKDKTGVVRLESDFPPERSPIVYHPSGSMNYNSINKTIPKIIEDVGRLLDKHQSEKGIIHTGNYKIARAIYEGIKNPRLIMRQDDDNGNEDLILRHASSDEPTVLLSPSLTTGADLRGDLSRFQIIVKLPWASLTDPRVSRRIKVDGDWYVAEMFRTFIQASGRSTRSADDWSVTYVLDSSFYSWVYRYRKWFPKQFLKRIIWDGSIRELS